METSDLRGPALMRAVADAIEAHPEQYEQEMWSTVTACGTAYCVGGWACILAYGASALSDPRGSEYAHGRYIEDEASDLLGLPAEETELLFHSQWEPAEWLTVPQALRAIAEGKSVESVTTEDYCRECETFDRDECGSCVIQ